MPLSISTDAITEKNKLANAGAWIVLLEVLYSGETPVYLCSNTSNIAWDGKTWIAAPFSLGDIEESRESTVPSVSLSIQDIARQVTPLLDDHDGAIGADVYVRVVHSAHLDNADPEIEVQLEIIDVNIDWQNTIVMKLGSENLSNYRSPPDRFLKNHCRYKEFKGTLCGYAGAETECDRTFVQCRDYGNQARFGGFPGVGVIGYYR